MPVSARRPDSFDSAPGRPWRPAIWFVVCLLATTACGRRAPKPPLRFPFPAAEQSSKVQDPSFDGPGTVTARHFQLKGQLVVTPKIDAFARLTATQRLHLKEMQGQSWLTTRVYALDDRVLIIPPARHPAGTLELLLCWDRDQLIVFSRDRWAYDLPMSALPDVLDRARLSRRDVTKATLTESEGKEPGSTPSKAKQVLAQRKERALVALRYWPRQRRDRPWSLSVQISLQLPLVAPQDAASYAPLPLVLPLLQNQAGRLVIEAMALRAGMPHAWVRTVNNETYGGFASPSFAHVLDDKGTVQLPLKRFAITRDGFRRASRIGAPHAGGAQGVEPQDLGLLRSGGSTAELKVDNRSALSAVIYLDGVPVGWVGAGKSFTFTGPRPGYYRVYAATPTGARAWGPHDMYLSGPLVLR